MFIILDHDLPATATHPQPERALASYLTAAPTDPLGRPASCRHFFPPLTRAAIALIETAGPIPLFVRCK
jgi:hypothetical protein